MTTMLNEEIRAFIGVKSEEIFACDAVESGAVRRYAQAIMDTDPVYQSSDLSNRFGGSIAPPLFPAFMFARPLGTSDALTDRAADPYFDGLVPGSGNGLPELPLPGRALLNGGSEIEFFRYAKVGERVIQRSEYADIYERESKNGPMLFVIIQTEYLTGTGDLLMRVRLTIIRR